MSEYLKSLESQIESATSVPNALEEDGQSYIDIADQFAGGTLATAIMQGLSRGVGEVKKAKGREKKRTKKEELEAKRQMELDRVKYAEEQKQYLDGIENQLKRQKMAHELTELHREPIKEAMRQFIMTGSVGAMNELSKNEEIAAFVSDSLPEGVNFAGRFRANEDKTFSPIGVDAQGREVPGEAISPFNLVRDPEGMKELLSLQSSAQDLNKRDTFVIREPGGRTRTIFATQADAQREADRVGGNLAGTAKIDLDAEAVATEGGFTDISLGKSGSNKVDTELLDVTANLARVSRIKDNYNPEFQQIPTQFKNSLLALKERFGGELNPEDKDAMHAFSEYRAQAAENTALTIKAISGAAVSEQEAQRLQQFLITPEDSPTQVEAKLANLEKSLKFAKARLSYIKARGMELTYDDMEQRLPLSDFGQIITQEGKRIEAEIKQQNPEISDQELLQQVKQKTATMFGLI